MATSNLMTVNELATYLKRAPGTIRNDVSAGRIPYKRVLGQIRFDREEIDQWIEQQSPEPVVGS